MKQLLIIGLVLLFSVAVIPTASADCVADLGACEELLDEVTCAECPPVVDCEKVCGWVTLVKDRTFMSAVIGGFILLIGGVAGIFITGSG